jgi:hypothetical protein
VAQKLNVQTFRFRVSESIVEQLRRKGVPAGRSSTYGTVFDIPGETKDKAWRQAIELANEVEKETPTYGEYRDPNGFFPRPVESGGSWWSSDQDLGGELSSTPTKTYSEMSPSERTLHDVGDGLRTLIALPLWLAGMAVLWVGLPLAALAVLVFVVKRLWYWF